MSQALLFSDPIPSVSLHDGRPATTSLEVAKFFGKRHDDVLKSIRNLLPNCPENFNARNFAVVNYLDGKRESRPMYIIYRDGFMLLVMGYTGKKALALKLAYIEAFNAMEEELARKKSRKLTAPSLPYADRVKALNDLERRFMEFSVETRTRLSELNAEYIRLNQGAYAAMLGMLPTMDPASKDRLTSALAYQSYDAYNWIDAGLSRMRAAIIAARAANRVLSGRG